MSRHAISKFKTHLYLYNYFVCTHFIFDWASTYTHWLLKQQSQSQSQVKDSAFIVNSIFNQIWCVRLPLSNQPGERRGSNLLVRIPVSRVPGSEEPWGGLREHPGPGVEGGGHVKAVVAVVQIQRSGSLAKHTALLNKETDPDPGGGKRKRPEHKLHIISPELRMRSKRHSLIFLGPVGLTFAVCPLESNGDHKSLYLILCLILISHYKSCRGRHHLR